MSIYLHNLASIQPRTSPKKFESSSSLEFEVELQNFKALICSPVDVVEAARNALHALYLVLPLVALLLRLDIRRDRDHPLRNDAGAERENLIARIKSSKHHERDEEGDLGSMEGIQAP